MSADNSGAVRWTDFHGERRGDGCRMSRSHGIHPFRRSGRCGFRRDRPGKRRGGACRGPRKRPGVFRVVQCVERGVILAEIRQGTRGDAVLLSAGANATNGERRTNEDKRRSVETLLRDEEWSQWSEREIGRRCAVSHVLVLNMRKQEAPSVNGLQIEPSRKVERNGTTYHMNTAKIGGTKPPPARGPTGGRTPTASRPRITSSLVRNSTVSPPSRRPQDRHGDDRRRLEPPEDAFE